MYVHKDDVYVYIGKLSLRLKQCRNVVTEQNVYILCPKSTQKICRRKRKGG